MRTRTGRMPIVLLALVLFVCGTVAAAAWGSAGRAAAETPVSPPQTETPEAAPNVVTALPDLYADYMGDQYWDGERVTVRAQGEITYSRDKSHMRVVMPHSDLRDMMLYGREIYDYDLSAAKYMAVQVKNNLAEDQSWFTVPVSSVGDSETCSLPEGADVYLRSTADEITTAKANNSGLFALPPAFEGWAFIPVGAYNGSPDFSHISRVSVYCTWYVSDITFGVIGTIDTDDAIAPDKPISVYNASSPVFEIADKVYDGTAAAFTMLSEDITDTQIVYSVKNGEDWTALEMAPAGVGSYKVTVTAKRGAAAISGEKTFEIERARPIVNPSYTGGTLYTSSAIPALTLAEDDTAGTVVILNTRLNAGTNLYSWKFTPEDTNYDAVVGSIRLTVLPVEPTGITVTPPTKTEYVEGETLDLTGMVVTAAFNDGSQTVVTDVTADKTVLAVSDTTVTVTYQGVSATFAVTVTQRPDTSGEGKGCGAQAGSSAPLWAALAVALTAAAMLIRRKGGEKR